MLILFVCMVSFNGCSEEDTVAPSPEDLSEKFQKKTRHTEPNLENVKSPQIPMRIPIKRIEPVGDFLIRFHDHLVTPDKESRELFGNLSDAKVPTLENASLAARYYLRDIRNSGVLSALESEHVVGLIRMGRDIQDFAQKGDFVWIVRFQYTNSGTYDEIWVSSTTDACISILKRDPPPIEK